MLSFQCSSVKRRLSGAVGVIRRHKAVKENDALSVSERNPTAPVKARQTGKEESARQGSALKGAQSGGVAPPVDDDARFAVPQPAEEETRWIVFTRTRQIRWADWQTLKEEGTLAPSILALELIITSKPDKASLPIIKIPAVRRGTTKGGVLPLLHFGRGMADCRAVAAQEKKV